MCLARPRSRRWRMVWPAAHPEHHLKAAPNLQKAGGLHFSFRPCASIFPWPFLPSKHAYVCKLFDLVPAHEIFSFPRRFDRGRSKGNRLHAARGPFHIPWPLERLRAQILRADLDYSETLLPGCAADSTNRKGRTRGSETAAGEEEGANLASALS